MPGIPVTLQELKRMAESALGRVMLDPQHTDDCKMISLYWGKLEMQITEPTDDKSNKN